MLHRRNFAAIALLLTAIALGNAASQPQPSPPVAAIKPPVLNPVRMTETQIALLKWARQRRQASTMRATMRALAGRQPEHKSFVDFVAVENSPTPVLVMPEKLETLRVIVRGEHYTAITRLGNVVVTIDGAHPAVRLPAGLPLLSAEKPMVVSTYKGANGVTMTDALEGIRIEQTMSGISMSFVRFGHLYDLSMDCPDAGQSDPEAVKPDAEDLERINKQFGSKPQGPSQCTAKNIRAIAGKLEVLGGRTR